MRITKQDQVFKREYDVWEGINPNVANNHARGDLVPARRVSSCDRSDGGPEGIPVRVGRMLKSGQLPAAKLDGQHRVRTDDFLKWWDN